MAGLQFEQRAVAGYDQVVGMMTRQLIPTLLKAGHLAAGSRILDVAAGTGLAAEAAAMMIGPSGHVTVTDISPAMIESAQQRLGQVQNVAFAVEDAQELSFPEARFDAVICNMGLMYFSDPLRGLVEMRRVLRPGGWLSVSVNTSPTSALLSRLLVLIDRHVPTAQERTGPAFLDGSESNLLHLFKAAGFQHVETCTKRGASHFHHSMPTSEASNKAQAMSARNIWPAARYPPGRSRRRTSPRRGYRGGHRN